MASENKSGCAPFKRSLIYLFSTAIMDFTEDPSLAIGVFDHAFETIS